MKNKKISLRLSKKTVERIDKNSYFNTVSMAVRQSIQFYIDFGPKRQTKETFDEKELRQRAYKRKFEERYNVRISKECFDYFNSNEFTSVSEGIRQAIKFYFDKIESEQPQRIATH